MSTVARRRACRFFGILGLLAAFLLPAGVVHAGVEVDVALSMDLGDDLEVFVALSSAHYGFAEDELRPLGRRHHPDDLAVACLLASRTGRSPAAVLALHTGSRSWWEVAASLGVPPDVWFLPVRRHPGPPYGRAYGHWKHRRGRGAEFVLSDDDIRNLVAVRVIHETTGVSVETAMEWRAAGERVDRIVGRELRRRHGQPSANRPGPKEGKGRGRGRGR